MSSFSKCDTREHYTKHNMVANNTSSDTITRIIAMHVHRFPISHQE